MSDHWSKVTNQVAVAIQMTTEMSNHNISLKLDIYHPLASLYLEKI